MRHAEYLCKQNLLTFSKREKEVEVSAYRTRRGTRVNPFRRRQRVKTDKDNNRNIKLALGAGLALGGTFAALKLARTVKKDKNTINNLFDFDSKSANFDFLSKVERKNFLRNKEFPDRLIETYSKFNQGDLVKHLLPNGSEHYGVVTVNPDTLEKKIVHVIRDLKGSADALPKIVESSLDENLHVPKVSLWQKVETGGSLKPEEINRRARLLIGAEVSYDSISNNCESYARLIVGENARSLQTKDISKITALGSSMLDNVNQKLRFIPRERGESPKFSIFGTKIYGTTSYGKSDVFYNQKQIKKILEVNEKSPRRDKELFNKEVEKIWRKNQGFSSYFPALLNFSSSIVSIDIFTEPKSDILDLTSFESSLNSFGIKQPKVLIDEINQKIKTLDNNQSKALVFKILSDYLKAIAISMNSVAVNK